MATINLSFPDPTYSTSNKPSITTLKADLQILEDGHNAQETTIADHESRLDTAESDIDIQANGPGGHLINGKIVTSVASNNLTVAIKTLAGNDPSASDPVYVRIGNAIRSITAALSVTKNAGTNWFNAGSATLATREVDYFVYLIWNTTSNPDAVTLGFARICHGILYSVFSGTSTNEKYLAFSGSDTPASTDECEVIGRFNATLSATPNFNWSIPSTSIIIQRPIFETRMLEYIPIPTNANVNNGSIAGRYKVIGTQCKMNMFFTLGSSSSVAGSAVTFTAPFTQDSGTTSIGTGLLVDSGTGEILGQCRMDASSSTFQVRAASTGSTLLEITTSVPFTWTTNDSMIFNLVMFL